MSSKRSSGRPSRLVLRQHLGVQLEPGKRNAALDAAMQLEQLEVHVHRVAELGLTILDGAELGRLARVGPARAWGSGGVIGHGAIIHKLPISDCLP